MALQTSTLTYENKIRELEPSTPSTTVFENRIPEPDHKTLSNTVFSNKIPEADYTVLSPALFENKLPSPSQLDIPTTPNSKNLHISAIGLPLICFPHPPKQLVTTIFAPNGRTAYTCTRRKRCSGTCILSTPETGDLISTTYRFGPGRPPVLRYVKNAAEGAEIEFEGKMFSCSQTFPTPNGRMLEWRYVKESVGDSVAKTRTLTLCDVGDGRKIARLLRTQETRTEGSKKTSAGNGGLLIIEDGAERMVEEALIVASCLVMLKKEIDRRMRIQGAVISAVIGGVSAA